MFNVASVVLRPTSVLVTIGNVAVAAFTTLASSLRINFNANVRSTAASGANTGSQNLQALLRLFATSTRSNTMQGLQGNRQHSWSSSPRPHS